MRQPLPTALAILDGQHRSRDFILGGLSIVDLAIGAFFMTKVARQLDLSDDPNLARWAERIGQLKGFRATEHRPANQAG